ncbi:MAG: OmpA family protein [Endozoicomonas sp. (ex Botrylloides leachii)]|nr:OmpA family protein [Endozoicomonas sp. (ex Botrylloides leachii)]
MFVQQSAAFIFGMSLLTATFAMETPLTGLAAQSLQPNDNTVVVQKKITTIYPDALEGPFWKLESTSQTCHLSNHVLGIGRVFLKAEAGNVEEISLQPDPYRQQHRHVLVGTQAPAWKPKSPIRIFQSKEIAAGKHFVMPVSVTQLVAMIKQGKELVIDINRKWDANVRIQVPSVQVQKTIAAFYQCQSQLPALNYQQAQYKQLFYHPNQGTLDDKHKQWLDNLVEYLGADPRVKKILIDAHADASGNDLMNLMLSKKRALSIQRYLIEKEIPIEKIQIKYHGERYPVVSNKTRSGRDKNRRVEIKLWR